MAHYIALAVVVAVCIHVAWVSSRMKPTGSTFSKDYSDIPLLIVPVILFCSLVTYLALAIGFLSLIYDFVFWLFN